MSNIPLTMRELVCSGEFCWVESSCDGSCGVVDDKVGVAKKISGHFIELHETFSIIVYSTCFDTEKMSRIFCSYIYIYI